MSPPAIASLIPAATAPPPLTTLSSPPPQLPLPEIRAFSRRSAAILLSSIILPILRPPLASAFSIGISGPKEWLKEQKKKSANFLLAPVDASRNILQSAYLLLTKSEAEFGEDDLDQVQKLLVSAARDCVPRDRNSFVEFQSNTGVEVCTFRLVVKNASSLLDDRDPLKLEAESKLDDLIRSFSSLSGMARDGSFRLALNSKERVVDAVKDAITSLNNFEQGIKDCLQVLCLELIAPTLPIAIDVYCLKIKQDLSSSGIMDDWQLDIKESFYIAWLMYEIFNRRPTLSLLFEGCYKLKQGKLSDRKGISKKK